MSLLLGYFLPSRRVWVSPLERDSGIFLLALEALWPEYTEVAPVESVSAKLEPVLLLDVGEPR